MFMVVLNSTWIAASIGAFVWGGEMLVMTGAQPVVVKLQGLGTGPGTSPGAAIVTL